MFDFQGAREIVLRSYQNAAIEAVRECIRQGQRRILLCAGTGAGKTLMAAFLLKQADRKGSYTSFIADRVALVQQTSDVFSEYGIRHGVVQGINKRWSPYENVQVCSALTLARRTLPREPALIVVDEAHCQIKSVIRFMEDHPEAVKIGLTATPFTKGMGKHWDVVVNVIPTRELINQGYLIEPTIYVAKSPDDSDLERNEFGEFSNESAASAGIKIVGDVVQEWIAKTYKHFGGPAKTIVFSPTVAHGEELCRKFREAGGYNFQQISYRDKGDEERLAKIAEFRSPDSSIHGLVSCGVLTKGFDVPEVRIGISCKPYRKSLSSHMQEIGRVMRSLPDGSPKTALWLDHSGNIERFHADMFDVWNNGAGELSKAEKRDSTPRERTKEVREKVVCPECGGLIRASTCVACGWERPARSHIHSIAGELREFKPREVTMRPRPGLRADCLSDPRKVWQAALYFCHERTNPKKARSWAYGVVFGDRDGIYAGERPPSGWYDLPVTHRPDSNAYALIEREVRKYRKNNRKTKGAA